MQGWLWQRSTNWADDNWPDPCLHNWMGVTCNKDLNIIGLHFFENHMIGEFPEEKFE